MNDVEHAQGWHDGYQEGYKQALSDISRCLRDLYQIDPNKVNMTGIKTVKRK